MRSLGIGIGVDYRSRRASRGGGDLDPIPPVSVVPPVASGALLYAGEEVTCTTGGWGDGGSEITGYEYDWYTGEEVYIGEGTPFTIPGGLVGDTIFCVVSATNALGTTMAGSNALEIVAEPVSYDDDTEAYVAAMTGEPGDALTGVYDTLIVALKTAGVWDKLDVLGLHANFDEQSATINLKDPTHFLTKVDSGSRIAFTAYEGFARSGNQTLDGHATWGAPSGWDSSNYSLNGNCVGVFNLTAAVAHNSYMFGFTAGTLWLNQISVANYFTWNNQSPASNNNSPGITPHNGLMSLRRNTSGAASFWRSKTKLTENLSYASDAGNIGSGDFTFFAGYLSGGDQYHANYKCALSYVGGALTDTEYNDMVDAFTAYLTSVGAV